jgi:Zn-dependent peptidase ImmA (M78 family)
VPDYRTIKDFKVVRPSPDLLETIYLSEQRQDWYRDYLRQHGADAPAFIGSVTTRTPVLEVAAQMREVLDFDLVKRRQFSNWTEALRGLIEASESAGVLVTLNGVVGSNTHRKLNPEEFRGFALNDDLAPLVFLNGADTKAAQIFTLTHELAHLWAGQSGVDRPDLEVRGDHSTTERWCNEVAAEFLVPLASLPVRLPERTLTENLEQLAREYKVSTLVVLRRLVDKRLLSWEEFGPAFTAELARVKALAARDGDGGGNYYNTHPYRVSRRFARAIIANALEGETLYRDAYRLLGVRKHETFQTLGEKLGVA